MTVLFKLRVFLVAKAIFFVEFRMLFIARSLFDSNEVIYRYIQNIYAPTSEELGTGISGSVRVVIDR